MTATYYTIIINQVIIEYIFIIFGKLCSIPVRLNKYKHFYTRVMLIM